MQKFFNRHPEIVLASLAVILLAILAAYYFWGVTTLVANLSKAINMEKEKPPQVEFNLKGAASLDLKGLVQ